MPTTLTITEALAEVKTIGKRIQKKVEYIGQHLMRHDFMRDPLEKEGGSAIVIARERQAIGDLERRLVAIRLAIQAANHQTPVTVDGETRMLADWLTWRKEVAPAQTSLLKSLRASIDNVRKQALQKGAAVVQAGQAATPQDVIVHVDEAALAKDTERMETILGGLDGQLSLKNATVLVTIPIETMCLRRRSEKTHGTPAWCNSGSKLVKTGLKPCLWFNSTNILKAERGTMNDQVLISARMTVERWWKSATHTDGGSNVVGAHPLRRVLRWAAVVRRHS